MAKKLKKDDFLELVKKLEELAAPTRRDEEHATIAHYINLFLSKLNGNEGCGYAGSTVEYTRLHTERDEGDSDFILISGKTIIPTSCLEYNPACPCFVKVRGENLRQDFNVDLVNGLYLPADLLRNARPEAFSMLRVIHKALTKTFHTIGRNTPRDLIPRQSQVGIEMREYVGTSSHGYESSDDDDGGSLLDTNVRGIFRAIGGFLGPVNLFNDDSSDGSDTPDESDFSTTTLYNRTEARPSGNTNSANNPQSYVSIATKDYVAYFRISGPPKGLEWFRERKQRKWPKQKVVDEIMSSNFYLVAKPGLINAREDIDFCFSFTEAERKLFEEIYRNADPTQRRCYLVLKAINKSALKDQNILKTFHWKTAFFWISENRSAWNARMLEESVLEALGYMIKCLEKGELMHFFVKSNLFAALKKPEMNTQINSVIQQIKKVQNNLTSSLREFFDNIENSGYDVDNTSSATPQPVARVRRLRADSVGSRRILDIVTDVYREIKSEDGDLSTYGTQEIMEATVEVARQAVVDARNRRWFLTRLDKPLLSDSETDMIEMAVDIGAFLGQVPLIFEKIAEFYLNLTS